MIIYKNMGTCQTETYNIHKIEVTKGNIQNEQQRHIIGNNPNNTHQTHLRQNECEVDPLKPYKEFEPNTEKRLSKEICRIVIETERGRKTGTGFILCFPIDLEWFFCLITNDHVIGNESINKSQIIYITYEDYKTACIKLDRNKRYIKSFADKELDITVVEILDEDNISKNYFLEPDIDIPINNQLIKKYIYLNILKD